jgi:sugar O-acyltransferase (sialic acid O-acetyltransferase NeuD family)
LNSSHPVIILGAGGHAKVVLNVLQLSGFDVLGLTDQNASLHGTEILGCLVLGGDAVVDKHNPNDIKLIIGVGSTKPLGSRKTLYQKFSSAGYSFAPVTHPSAAIAPDVILAPGTQIMAGAVIQPSCQIGQNTIINTRTSIDHDCQIGDHVHIAPGTVLSGDVVVEDDAHIGPGATIIEGIKIGAGAVVAAGACLVGDVPSNSRVSGIPAKPF